jgi:O-antigen/teichoic acid export membrane protein
MKQYLGKAKLLVFSSTARDTYFLFVGNVFSAFWGFLFTVFAARAMTLADFGIFSAALNFVNIISSLSDVGISSGSVNFVSEHIAKGDHAKANEYIKASFIVRLSIVLIISALVVIFAPIISVKLLATRDPKIAIWAAVIPIFLFPDMFFPPILQAKKKFLQSTIIDNVFYIGRLVFAFGLYIYGALNISMAFAAFGVGFLAEAALTVYYLKIDYFFAKPTRDEYSKLLKFSGWIGVNRVISSISGKLDIQMLAAMVGAVATGIYSIPSRLASFIIVLAGSFSAVLATRMAGFGNKDREKSYILKSTLALLPIAAGVLVVVAFARPFILILFGQKYVTAIPIFQALALAQIPFLFTVPSVTAIIYSMKKTIFIGTFSFFQLAAMFLLNFFLIPKYGPFGPTITYGIVNTVLAIYTWVIVIKYYWGSGKVALEPKL